MGCREVTAQERLGSGRKMFVNYSVFLVLLALAAIGNVVQGVPFPINFSFVLQLVLQCRCFVRDVQDEDISRNVETLQRELTTWADRHPAGQVACGTRPASSPIPLLAAIWTHSLAIEDQHV